MAQKNNAQPGKAESSAIKHTCIFAYPRQQDTARAEVLARMLEGEAITAADSYRGSSTMRLAAQVHALRHTYGWPVLSDEVAAPCADGRTAHIARYSLTSDTIAQARRKGAIAWCMEVHKARAAKRAKARTHIFGAGHDLV